MVATFVVGDSSRRPRRSGSMIAQRAVRATYLVTHDQQTAQDVVQDAFLKIYKRIWQFDARRQFGPWFLKCVLNDAIKAARRRDRQNSLDELESDGARLVGIRADRRSEPEEIWEEAEVMKMQQSAARTRCPSGAPDLLRDSAIATNLSL